MTSTSRDPGPRRPVLRTDADVTAMWRTILQPLGWHTRRLYLVLVEPDRRPLPGVLEIDGIPTAITPGEAADVARLLSSAVGMPGEPSGSAAVLLARPGGATLTDDDRSLCHALYTAATTEQVALEVLHVGTDTAVVPAPMDEVLPRSA